MESFLNIVSVSFQFLEEGFYIDLNWLGTIIRWIIEGVGSVGVGVIVFTLILRAITTPFDIYQRVTTRKQSLVMRSMQGDLEKLQKQYANDKNAYNQKMLELQRKNGYNPFGACLPMIISLVILIVAVSAFQSYAQYGNLSMYEYMAESYNAAVMVYAADGIDYRLDGGEEGNTVTWEINESHQENGLTYVYYESGGITYMTVSSDADDVYLFYTYSLEDSTLTREYQIDIDKLYYNQTDETVTAAIDAYVAEGYELETACRKYFQNIGAEAAAYSYREEHNPGFLWIKNLWYPDVAYSHPIQDYDSFTSAITSDIYSDNWDGARTISDVFSESEYNLLTAALEEEKDQANGYFILIILTVGLMVLSQFLTMRSQKESNQYQTADGQGAKTQKIMMIALPLIYAITGFMWTAAFSIYIAMGSVISILVTLISNFFIDKKYRKKEEEIVKQKYNRKLPWQEEKTKKKKK